MNNTPTDEEYEILKEALLIGMTHQLPRTTWVTWDAFAGRNIEHHESTESWTLRILSEARRRCAENPKITLSTHDDSQAK